MLAATGIATIRSRKMPAEQVIWLVISLALFRPTPALLIVRSRCAYFGCRVEDLFEYIPEVVPKSEND
ncbi:transposase domain-containing protein [Deefgea tanakiae]|uniref:Transposase domain-containing protein n=1 Tax=Deefgea tanakiae TaxID=2865840 RepID=A0ABX8Z4A0_9NEIS|nr:transposase domain-containing protein [Deefgea tanakiae]QZA77406.1 transposase domain-containing protein [Deefgea tanakiae]